MSTYKYRSSTYKQQRASSTISRIVKAIIIIIVLIAIIIGVDMLLSRRSDNEVQTSGIRNAIEGSSVKVFRTKYFQFQADEDWVSIDTESTENKYVYRSMQNELIRADLYVYVNALPSEVFASRVQPVHIVDGTRVTANGPISEHCKGVIPVGTPAFPPVQVKQAEVTFSCQADASLFSVVVGESGGNTSISLNRLDGTVANYFIMYRDLTSLPDGRTLKEIISSFQSL